MSNITEKLGKFKKWLLEQGGYLYSGFAGALIGGAVGRSIETFAKVWNNPYVITLLDVFGTIVICLSGVFLLRIANNVELINRLVHSYMETRAKKGKTIDPIELQNYEREKQEEHGGHVLSDLACFLVCFIIGVFLIVISHSPGFKIN